MTIQVRITHDTPNYDKAIDVEIHGTCQPEPLRTKRVQPGDSVTEYVYAEQYLVVREVPKS